MKTCLSNRIVLLTCSLLFPLFTFCQEAHINEVILHVNTQNIKRSTVDENCNFGQPESISNEAYTIEVERNDFIVWKGLAEEGEENDIVKIVSIDYASGFNFFGTTHLGDNGQGEVLAELRTGEAGQVMKYNIVFEVYNGERKRGTYKIDPKIKIR